MLVIILMVIVVAVIGAYFKMKTCENSPCLMLRLNGRCPYDFKRSCTGCQYLEPIEKEKDDAKL